MRSPASAEVAPHDEVARARSGVGVRLRAVRQVFPGNVVAIEHVNLDVAAGEFLAIIGPSGCGKSTLLRLIAGLDRPSAGSVTLDDAPDRRRDIACVFQDAHLLPWRTVLKNVMLPLEFAGRADRATRTEGAQAALERVGLADVANRYPAQLSGGMRMRVSLARAMVTRPRLLLLDEPFAALDEITRQRLDEQLRELWRTTGMTVVFVTHSIAEAIYLADRVVLFSARPGRVVLDRKVDLPGDRPAILRGTPAFAQQSADLFAALRVEQEGPAR